MSNTNWIFGYGSLIWRPDFPYIDQKVGYIQGWSRRFYQGSTDHRGIPGSPGRVATLITDPSSTCWGVAYRVSDSSLESVFSYLDHREKGGFSRHLVEFYTKDSKAEHTSLNVHFYVAKNDNPNYLGPADMPDMAQQIHRSSGPSGPNIEYLTRLAEGLRSIGVDDQHVFELEKQVLLLEG